MGSSDYSYKLSGYLENELRPPVDDSPEKNMIRAILYRTVLDAFSSTFTNRRLREDAINYIGLNAPEPNAARSKKTCGYTFLDLFDILDLCPYDFHRKLRSLFLANAKIKVSGRRVPRY